MNNQTTHLEAMFKVVLHLEYKDGKYRILDIDDLQVFSYCCDTFDKDRQPMDEAVKEDLLEYLENEDTDWLISAEAAPEQPDTDELTIQISGEMEVEGYWSGYECPEYESAVSDIRIFRRRTATPEEAEQYWSLAGDWND